MKENAMKKPTQGICKLTELQVKNYKAQEKDYLKSDGGGLNILIKSNGTKLFRFIYESPTLKKRRKASLGIYPKTSLRQARANADEFRKLLAKEIDPLDYFSEIKDKETLAKSLTFKRVCYEWLEQTQKPKLALSTYERKKNQLENDFIQVLADIPISKIHHSQIAQIIKLKAVQTPETASRYLGYLDNLWRYSCSLGYCESNIIANLHKDTLIPRVQVKNYSKIVNEEILSELIDFIYNYKGDLVVRTAMKFLLYLPLRVGNLINLKWENIDFKNQSVTIARSEMKVKNPNLNDFKMYLSDEIIIALRELEMYTKNDEFIFSIKGKQISNETLNRTLQRGGFNDEARGRKQRSHSFRGTFSSLTKTHRLNHKLPLEIADLVLDHQVGNEVSRAYDNKADYFLQCKEMLKWWERYLLDLKTKEIKK